MQAVLQIEKEFGMRSQPLPKIYDVVLFNERAEKNTPEKIIELHSYLMDVKKTSEEINKTIHRWYELQEKINYINDHPPISGGIQLLVIGDLRIITKKEYQISAIQKMRSEASTNLFKEIKKIYPHLAIRGISEEDIINPPKINAAVKEMDIENQEIYTYVEKSLEFLINTANSFIIESEEKINALDIEKESTLKSIEAVYEKIRDERTENARKLYEDAKTEIYPILDRYPGSREVLSTLIKNGYSEQEIEDIFLSNKITSYFNDSAPNNGEINAAITRLNKLAKKKGIIISEDIISNVKCKDKRSRALDSLHKTYHFILEKDIHLMETENEVTAYLKKYRPHRLQSKIESIDNQILKTKSGLDKLNRYLAKFELN